MKYSINPQKTRAILLGTSEYLADFNNIEQVENNITDFAEVLTNSDFFGLKKSDIKIILNKDNVEMEELLDDHVQQAIKDKKTSLIIYFAGHGFKTSEGDFYLIAKNSKKSTIQRSGNSALWYETVKKIIDNVKIKQKIVLLDACYSGLAAQGEEDFKQLQAKGTYVLTSSDKKEPSFYDTDAKHTTFTGEMLNVIKNGLPTNEEKISVNEFFSTIKRKVEKKQPKMSPQIVSKGEVSETVYLFKNKKFDKIAIILEQAKDLFDEGNYTEAVKKYKEAVSDLALSDNDETSRIKTIKTDIKNAELHKKIKAKFYVNIEKIIAEKTEELNKQIQDLQNKKTATEQKLQTQISTKEEIYNKLLQEKKETEKQLKAKETELKNTVKNDKAVYDKLLTEKTKLEQKNTEINKKLSQKDKEISNLNKQLTEKQAKIKLLEAEIQKLKNPQKPKPPKISTGSNFTEKLANTAFDMIYVKGGTFKMGSNDGDRDEKPIHDVSIKDFYIAKHQVTQKLWKEIMGNNPSYFKGDNLPVEKVSWDDAQEFIIKLNAKTGKKYRLPSEAEWEFAARGGTIGTTRGHTPLSYAGSNNIDEVAEYEGNNNRNTKPVGGKKANELGIYDMSGNVWEWCQDKWYDDYKGAPTDGSAWESGNSSYRVHRGGSWFNYAASCRVANRGNFNADFRGNFLGFRLALSPIV